MRAAIELDSLLRSALVRYCDGLQWSVMGMGVDQSHPKAPPSGHAKRLAQNCDLKGHPYAVCTG